MHLRHIKMTNDEKKQLEERVIMTLKSIYDPEIPVDIYELGLIYDVVVRDDASIYIKMTLTSPACPVAGTLPGEVQSATRSVPGIGEVTVELTWDPPFTVEMMSEEVRLMLGLM